MAVKNLCALLVRNDNCNKPGMKITVAYSLILDPKQCAAFLQRQSAIVQKVGVMKHCPPSPTFIDAGNMRLVNSHLRSVRPFAPHELSALQSYRRVLNCMQKRLDLNIHEQR